MARHELLNNVAHQQLRVVTRFGREYGDDVGMVSAYPTEFAELQREYPIFLRKDRQDGHWQAVALLGFEAHENLFVQDGRWNAAYLPGAIAKGPFLIGFQEQRIDGELRREPVIHVDVEHPRVSFSEGEAVFLPHGGNSPYLEHISGVLRGLRDGLEAATAMYAAYDALGLIQPMNLELQLDTQHRVSLAGLHGIDRDRLAALDADQLHGLHRSGYLEGVYLLLASLHNLRRLMAEKQRRLRQAEAA
ncbi:SapC family protein [Pseudoxanthomonas indica]|uniref:SapC protein n=1 Tax=Pseudoxanthomonas indica TaxID=428993 RepID=A0A1T5K9W5_9GAMM|nr:SapC family protein [Pseudoxanthomonas indica]GGD47646.1 peptide ABC transporter permease [Pseudoxanthomonas indica]SKC60238.1 SapC protein [Pseudoxanthomonas indica]